MRILLPVLAALVPAALFPDLSFYFDITPKIVLLLAGMALVPFVLETIFAAGAKMATLDDVAAWASVCLDGNRDRGFHSSCLVPERGQLAPFGVDFLHGGSDVFDPGNQ